MVGAAGASPASETERKIIVNPTEGLWGASDLDGGAEGAKDGGEGRGVEIVERREIRDPLKQARMAAAGGAAKQCDHRRIIRGIEQLVQQGTADKAGCAKN